MSKLHNLGRFATLFLSLAAFAVWIGGFTFYAAVVVPIGTEILGSARAQGEITQAVTHGLNLCSAIAIVMLSIEWWLTRQRLIRLGGGKCAPAPVGRTMLAAAQRAQRGIAISIIVMLVLLVVLWVVHQVLDDFIGGSRGKLRITQRASFYSWHRVYLWTSTLQWLAGWVWLGFFVARPPFERDTGS